MELAAYTTGRRDYLEELVLMDKWATSLSQVRAFVDEILSLPYHQEMREHYR
jgi:alpha-galactosidase/6-phospho-beta-glucosidase family protein